MIDQQQPECGELVLLALGDTPGVAHRHGPARTIFHGFTKRSVGHTVSAGMCRALTMSLATFCVPASNTTPPMSATRSSKRRPNPSRSRRWPMKGIVMRAGYSGAGNHRALTTRRIREPAVAASGTPWSTRRSAGRFEGHGLHVDTRG